VTGGLVVPEERGVTPALPEPRATPPRRPFVHKLAELELESGVVLRDVEQLYHLDGVLNEARDNLVVIFHALTGSADAAGDWWRDVVGPGRALDTDRYAVLCGNLLGSCYGTTGPWDPARRPFPRVTTRDMAVLAGHLIATLRVDSVALAVGGSLGGMVAMELAASFPTLVRRTVVLAAPAAHTAAAIGWNHIQRRAIAAAGPEGLEIARMLAMMTYRTGDELAQRFGRNLDAAGGFQVERYLNSQGHKLRARFDVESYVTLLDAMDSHDVGRGRGDVASALRRVEGELVGVGIPGDLLYDVRDVRGWTDSAGAEYREVHSIHGHDAFLIEVDQVAAILHEALTTSAGAFTASSSSRPS
jgi:homoserine O-acetyltransferase